MSLFSAFFSIQMDKSAKIFMTQEFNPQEFYERLQKAQRFVTNEIAFCEIGQAVRHGKLQQTGKSLDQVLIAMKQYYTAHMMLANPVLRIYKQRWGKDTAVLFHNVFTAASHCPEHQCPSDFKHLDLNQFCSLCDRIPLIRENSSDEDRKVMDIMTYSIIPSYFRFFLTASMTERLRSFLKQIIRQGEDRYCQLCRVLFVDPHFLFFVRQTFQDLLVSVFRNRGPDVPVNLDKFVNQVLEQMKTTAWMIPMSVKLVISCAPETIRKRILDTCFLRPFTKDPRRFMGCNYFDTPREEFLANFATKFREAGMDEFVRLLVDGIPSVVQEGVGIICEKNEKIGGSALERTVYSTLDHKATGYLSDDKRKHAFAIDNDPLTLFFVSSQNIHLSSGDILVTTMIPADARQQVMCCVRDMMKIAPLLPEGERLDPAVFKHPLDVVKKYLVEQVPLEIMPMQLYLLSQARHYCCGVSTADVTNQAFFSAMEKEHANQVEKVSDAIAVEQEMRRLLMDMDEVITNTLSYLRFVIIKSFPFQVPEELVHDPIKFRQTVLDMTQHFEGFSRQYFHDPNCFDVCYHIVSEKLDYNVFMSQNMDLSALDAIFHMYLKKSDPLMNSQKVVHALMDDLSRWDPLAKRLVNWTLENSNPLAKLISFNDVMVRAEQVVKRSLGARIVASDDLTPVFLTLLRYAAPPKLVSCLAYMMNYLISERHDPYPDLKSKLPSALCQPATTITAFVVGLFPAVGPPLSSFMDSMKVVRHMCVVGTGERAVTTLMALSGVTNRDLIENSKELVVRYQTHEIDFEFETTFARTRKIDLSNKPLDVLIYCYEPSEAAELGDIQRLFKPFRARKDMLRVVLCVGEEEMRHVSEHLASDEEFDPSLLESCVVGMNKAVNQAKSRPIVPMDLKDTSDLKAIRERLWKRLRHLW